MHRQARDSWDESADLNTLAVTPMTVVCSGVKSILDVGATIERLETLNVGVLGFGTHRFPGFYLTDSGFTVDWTVRTRPTSQRSCRSATRSQIPSALVVANPLPESEQLDPDVHDQVLEEGLRLASARNVSGQGRHARSCSTTSTAPRTA